LDNLYDLDEVGPEKKLHSELFNAVFGNRLDYPSLIERKEKQKKQIRLE